MTTAKLPPKDYKHSRSMKNCNHIWTPVYEDHILMGMVYYGDTCELCGKYKEIPKGPLELGTYK